MPWLGATARPMLIARLRLKRPSTHEVLTSGNFRNASAQARTSMSVIVTFSAPGTESFSCWRMLTASSTRASTVTVNSGTVDLASLMRRAMVACIRVGSMTSTSGPAARGAASGRRRSAGRVVLAAAITSSLTIRPLGALPPGAHHIIFDDAALRAAALERCDVDAHLGRETLGERRGFHLLAVAAAVAAGRPCFF